MTTNDGEDLSRPDQDEPETPKSFLAALGKALKEAEGVRRRRRRCCRRADLDHHTREECDYVGQGRNPQARRRRAAPSIAETSVG